MPRTMFASLLAALPACLAVALAPAAAPAQSDGGVTFAATGPQPATGPGGTLLVRSGVILGRTLRVRGTLTGGQAGRPVTVERQQKDGTWVTTATATTTQDGAFAASWTVDHIGRFPLRAVPGRGARASAAGAPATGVTPVTVYRQAVATFFGPGFFGRTTACGTVLRQTTLGVAHRTLPCGTLVDVYYRGRSITVPVIDRGPFRRGTTWDLTSAAAEALAFTGTGRIGALRLPRAPGAPAG